jgi:hypothetical protein
VLHCPNNGETSLQHRLIIAGPLQIKEAVPWAIELANGKADFAAAGATARLRALLLVGQLGDHEFVEGVEPLLADRTICYSRQAVRNRTPNIPEVDVELRDIALNVLLHLTQQSPTDYGYPQTPRPNVQDISSISMMFPRSAGARDSAIAKWRRWKSDEGQRRGGNGAKAPEKAGN